MLVLGSCSEDPSEEPDPRGEGEVGDECVTTRDCAVELSCIGTAIEEPALCAPTAALPGNEDPGCLDNVEDWEGHQSDGLQPIGDDEEGCDQLLFVSSCNCRGSAGEDCIPRQPHYRRERWRKCDSCWRLVAFWQEIDACD